MKKKLERLMYMGLGAVIAVGGYFFGTFHSDQVDAQLQTDNVEYNEISCRKLTLVDEKGQTKIKLDGDGIAIYNKDGKPVVMIAQTPYSSGAIAIYNKDGKPVVMIAPNEVDSGAIVTYNKDGKGATKIATTPDGSGAIELYNRDGKMVTNMTTTETGDGVIGIFNKDGKKVRTIH